MSKYLIWDKITDRNTSNANVTNHYNNGYVFTREVFGSYYKTRSLRINLLNFDLTSENRRVLKNVPDLKLHWIPLPLAAQDYDWKIHKLGKDYYQSKFGVNVFSASKIKELVTTQHNFTSLLKYTENDSIVGYTIAYDNNYIRHYAYPFYDLENFRNNYGMGMMLLALIDAKAQNKKFVYLGSASRPEDVYKLQFKGLEWFDGENWTTDISKLKTLLTISEP